jgi:CheY-like chemotaxis protein
MQRVRLFHWKAAEASSLVDLLHSKGFVVDYAGESANGNFRSLRETPPIAAIIDLTRLPSHGRYVAAAIRGTKSTRHIPIVFLDGEAEKVERLRGEIPDAVFTSRARLASVLKGVKPVANPVVPPRMMDSYAGRTAAEKLGIRKASRVALLDPPPDYGRALGKLPEGTSLEEDPDEILPVTLWFTHSSDDYLARLPGMRPLAAKSKLWVLWRKQSTRQRDSRIDAGLTQPFIRESALALGLVDYKICSVNEEWSGLLFTWKK